MKNYDQWLNRHDPANHDDHRRPSEFELWADAHERWQSEYQKALDTEINWIFSANKIPPGVTEKVTALKANEPKFPHNIEQGSFEETLETLIENQRELSSAITALTRKLQDIQKSLETLTTTKKPRRTKHRGVTHTHESRTN